MFQRSQTSATAGRRGLAGAALPCRTLGMMTTGIRTRSSKRPRAMEMRMRRSRRRHPATSVREAAGWRRRATGPISAAPYTYPGSARGVCVTRRAAARRRRWAVRRRHQIAWHTILSPTIIHESPHSRCAPGCRPPRCRPHRFWLARRFRPERIRGPGGGARSRYRATFRRAFPPAGLVRGGCRPPRASRARGSCTPRARW